MKIEHPWQRDNLLVSPAFRPLHDHIERLPAARFPDLDDLNALLPTGEHAICVRNGRALRFVPQSHGKLPFEAQYEPRCYLQGEVQSREGNWHDLLNALVWFAFPTAKRAINARHFVALTSSRHGAERSERGAVRDMNTLFDESGVVIPYADADLAALLKGFAWKELFWQRRQDVRNRMAFYLFGHGLYEKALAPYSGMTGQGLLLPVEEAFFSWSLDMQMKYLDVLIADYFDDPRNVNSTRELTPVPLLGIPGWTADNEQEHYYEDTRYFRPGRRGQADTVTV